MDGLNLKIDEPPLVDPPKPSGGSKFMAVLKLAFALRPSKLIRQILIGCFCSLVIGVITNLPYIKAAVLWVCQIILAVGGRPDLPEPVKKKFDIIVAKGREVAERAEAQKERHPVLPFKVLKDRVESKVKEEVEEKVTHAAAAPVKEAATKVKEKVVSAGKAAKQEAGKVREQLDDAAKALKDAAQQRQQEADRRAVEAKREDTIQRAVKLNIPWKGRPIEEVLDDVTAAEARRAPNAQCPYCHLPRRIVAKHGDFRCPRCGGFYSASTARSLGPPAAAPAQRPAVRLPFSSRGVIR